MIQEWTDNWHVLATNRFHQAIRAQRMLGCFASVGLAVASQMVNTEDNPYLKSLFL